MKVLNLRCVHDHRFEGWFASGEDFESQNQRQLVECPVCGEHSISRLPSAPHLNVSTLREAPAAPEPNPPWTASALAILSRRLAEDLGKTRR